MSTVYSYYIGYFKDNKIYPFGPFNCFGKYVPVLERTRSFASDLYQSFHTVSKDVISDEFIQKVYNLKDGETYQLEYIPVSYEYIKDLGDDNFIKTGYFLKEDVEEYFKNGKDPEGLFYSRIDPVIYAELVKDEAIYGYREQDENSDRVVYNASDYMYFAYPDYLSREYEISCIKTHACNLAGDIDIKDLIVVSVID